MNEIKFKVRPGGELPQYNTITGQLLVKAIDIKSIFSGNNQTKGTEEFNIKAGFKRSGYIKLRANERIVFDTRLSIKVPPTLEVQTEILSDLAINKGLVLIPSIFSGNEFQDIYVILSNTTNSLPKIKKGDNIACLVRRAFENIPPMKVIGLE